jgi:hypothetical protein
MRIRFRIRMPNTGIQHIIHILVCVCKCMCADPVPDPDWYSIYHTCSLFVYACVRQVSSLSNYLPHNPFLISIVDPDW